MGEISIMVAALLLLVAGAELLVRSGAFIATRLGVPPLAIGLTIVAFGTSAPEAVASIAAAFRGSAGIAVGNIVGSNLTNSLLVAGTVALIAPIAVPAAALKRDGVLALLAAAAFWLVCSLQALNAVTGTVLLLVLVLYVFQSYRAEKTTTTVGALRSRQAARGAAGMRYPSWSGFAMSFALVGTIVGVALLALGGHLLVDSALALATEHGVSEAVVGLTIIGIGTSAPELATSALAALRSQTEIALGNIIGSNIFNVLGIGGLTALLSQGEVPARIVGIDFPLMLGAMAFLLLFAFTGRRVGRLEGLLLVGAFCLYSGSVWLIGTPSP